MAIAYGCICYCSRLLRQLLTGVYAIANDCLRQMLTVAYAVAYAVAYGRCVWLPLAIANGCFWQSLTVVYDISGGFECALEHESRIFLWETSVPWAEKGTGAHPLQCSL